MCLDALEKDGPKEGTGWKVFWESCAGRLYGKYRSEGKRRLRRRWLNERDFRDGGGVLDTNLGQPYLAGFHLFVTKNEAKRWGQEGLHKVRFRKAVAWGKQSGLRVVVAKEIFIY